MSRPPEPPSPVVATARSGPGPALSPLAAGLNVVGLGLLDFGVAGTGRPHPGGATVAFAVLLTVATAGWLVWTAGRAWPLPAASLAASLLAMAAAGAALCGFASVAMVFPAVAALGATLALPGRQAAGVILVAAAALAAATPFEAGGAGVEIGASAAVVAGSVVGLSRRATQYRQQQEANLRVAEAQAEAERARAELLAGRNHLARELHDVLAHTLSALSVQLQALDALMADGPPNPEVTAQLAEIRRLVQDGLDEARGAVAALRSDLPPLDERLRQLAASRGVTPAVTGTVRDLPAEVSLGLYRVAQEALTNAARHAPGAPVDVELAYGAGEVTLTVTNDTPTVAAPAPAGTDLIGHGYGLQGIRERILLLAGTVDAGPGDGYWKVRARVPVAR